MACSLAKMGLVPSFLRERSWLRSRSHNHFLIVGLLRLDGSEKPFCTVGAIRDLVMVRDSHLFNGVLAFIVIAFATNIVIGKFHPGFEGQPIAHTNTSGILRGWCFQDWPLL